MAWQRIQLIDNRAREEGGWILTYLEEDDGTGEQRYRTYIQPDPYNAEGTYEAPEEEQYRVDVGDSLEAGPQDTGPNTTGFSGTGGLMEEVNWEGSIGYWQSQMGSQDPAVRAAAIEALAAMPRFQRPSEAAKAYEKAYETLQIAESTYGRGTPQFLSAQDAWKIAKERLDTEGEWTTASQTRPLIGNRPRRGRDDPAFVPPATTGIPQPTENPPVGGRRSRLVSPAGGRYSRPRVTNPATPTAGRTFPLEETPVAMLGSEKSRRARSPRVRAKTT